MTVSMNEYGCLNVQKSGRPLLSKDAAAILTEAEKIHII